MVILDELIVLRS